MNKVIVPLLLGVSISLTLTAQNKQLSIEDVVTKQRTTLAPEKLEQLAWVPKGTTYSFIEKIGSSEVLATSNAFSDKKSTLLTLNEFNEKLKKLEPNTATCPKFPTIKWLSDTVFYFPNNKILYRYGLINKAISPLNQYADSAENAEWNEQNFAVAYTQKNNLFVKPKDVAAIQLTTDGNENIVYGQAVHRNEFAILKGTFWSPKGNLLAFYRMDQSMVTNYPLINLNSIPAKTNNIKYPMAGQTSHQVTVGIYNLATGKTLYLNTGEPKDQYLTNITWTPDEHYIYIAVLNRAQNHLKLNIYDATTGQFLRTQFEERSDKYIEPEHGPIFLKNNSDRFLWHSARNGFNQLYLYDTKGELLGAPISGNLIVTDFIGFDEKGETFYYTAIEENNLDKHIYSFDLSTRTSRKLTSIPASHSAMLSDKKDMLIVTYTSTAIPRNIEIINKTGKKIKTLLQAQNPLRDYTMGQMRIFTIKAADNTTDLFCRMIVPPGFDSTKKYPTLVYQYGGPHAQMVTNIWLGGGDMWLHYMATQGYVVFTLDNRGSGNRGLSFEQATYKKLGTNELADQMQGFKYLRSKTYVDTTRMGLYGWSFGGFMTTTVMTKQPNIFKAAVAGGPVIDWKYYEIMYTERYMSTPEINPDGYGNSSLLNNVENLKGRLLMIHGTDDDVVVWQHSQLFLKKCIDKGILLDYFVYPGHKHNVLGKDRVHLMRKVTDYFNLHLKG